MSEQKTHADIIAEYRSDADETEEKGFYEKSTCYIRKLLDRLEAAHKREVATTENSSAVGDAAKLREAVEKLMTPFQAIVDGTTVAYDPDTVLKIAKEALAAPRRNCDVGTAEEQTARYDKFCNMNRTVEKCCTDCPALGVADCEFIWGQRPYESEAAK